MRWIFFVLIGANILLLAWQLLGPASSEAPQQVVRTEGADVPHIVLLKEAGVQGRNTPPPSPRHSANASARESDMGAAEEAGQSLCTFVGPYSSEENAALLVERLAAMDVDGQVVEVEIPAGPGYWVHLEPFESRREALRHLADLQAQGIDSYIIPKGDLKNGISLGMFSREQLAHARVEEVAALGVDAKIEIIERSYKEIWVSIPEASARKLGDQAWQRLLEGNKSINRRQNFCLHVASQDKFH